MLVVTQRPQQAYTITDLDSGEKITVRLLSIKDQTSRIGITASQRFAIKRDNAVSQVLQTERQA